MKAIMVMFDSLNRHMLPPYGCDWTHAPNFARLASNTVTFTNSFVGSMPCMPARRELHTGRLNFLHRSWGPLEPFDDSMPQILKQNGVYSHLCTDHYHYWEDGGATYLHRFSSWEGSRGQEGDTWKGEVAEPDRGGAIGNTSWYHSANIKHMQNEEDQPQSGTFRQAIDFIETNHNEDNWFLSVETFDPHEPFFSSQKYKDLYPHGYDGPDFYWPIYKQVDETPEQVEHCRYEYAALLSMCDENLGKILDMMDKYDMWKDTMLIVNTDHGFLLGEHDWWAKVRMPWYNELAHTPFFIWDPRCGRKGETCDALVQTIDIAPTLLEYFGQSIPEDMQGFALKDTVASDKPVREALLFGVHGKQVNCTDGRYVYMRDSEQASCQPLYNYTLMPTHMRGFFSLDELKNIELEEPFSFTKGVQTMKIRARPWGTSERYPNVIYDLLVDPGQQQPVDDPEVEKRMIGHMVRLMMENDAPVEQYERLGLVDEWKEAGGSQ